MKLIVGLGNPGLRYKKTRHNIGFMFLDKFAKDNKLKFALNKSLKSEIASLIYKDEKIFFIKPQTFMNLSGDAVLAVMNFYKIDLNDILVIYDDLDLPTGKLRLRLNGTSGGHKGMDSIIRNLKTNELKRLRIGIGRKDSCAVVDYVLDNFYKDEKIEIDLALEKSTSIIMDYLENDFLYVMNKYNQKEI